MTTSEPAAAAATIDPEYHIELRSGKRIRILAAGLSDDDGERVEQVGEQISAWKTAGACLGLPAPGQYVATLDLVVIPWDSVDSIGLVLPPQADER